MSRRGGGSARYLARAFPTLLSLVGLLLLLVFAAGIVKAGDVSSAEAHGELGFGAPQTETTVSESTHVLAEASAEVPWVETSLYLLVSSLIFAGYAFAARRLPWLRPRRHRKS